ncbi:MAG: sucrose synthase [Deltaproteobacteria bacterium RIFOXYD12_FULL_56_24]|nr:MAG: sucrose synthase [Deltaproteobacteria bacterium RIFOXYD12_FULL_56_24]
MTNTLSNFIDEQEIPLLLEFIFSIPAPETSILLRNDILLAFETWVGEGGQTELLPGSWRFLRKVQEILCLPEERIVVYRHRKASCRLFAIQRDKKELSRLSARDFLSIKERLVRPDLPAQQRTMELNLAPFYDYGPSLKDPNIIGHGIRHLNRYLSANLASQPEKWQKALYEFLKLHQLHGVQLLLDGAIIRDVGELETALEYALDTVDRFSGQQDVSRLKGKLQALGFLDGWGSSPARILETMNLLQDILEQPNEETLEEFLASIPMISKVALISPHGWFAQENVLGRPDTGGQVVYVLDQAKALERFLAQDLRNAGLDIDPMILIVTRLIPEDEGTTANQRLEKVWQTKNVWILRVPFQKEDNEVVPHWLSRFRVWPYLDQFAIDVEQELRQEFGGRPDLIVGNYSDGNLVATLLSQSMGVTQSNIAHALEKSKYLFSDLHWGNFEAEYHFSVQFMADLMAMNLADFIISSTSQEIIGTDQVIGQYESYQFFTMPGLLNVTNGINLFHPRFNVIPPGVDPATFFPYTQRSRREKKTSRELEDLLFSREDQDCFGHLARPELPPIFSIARLDRIKNLTGLVEAYGKDRELRARANLVVIASVLDPERSRDGEEAEEIRKMHRLLAEYDLHASVRWIGKLLGKEATGEAYRLMADRRGIFVQPALFEAFGLTILEAMHSGLPVFVTMFGGPGEIVEHGKSGFLINPTNPEAMTACLVDFFADCAKNPKHWQIIAKTGMKRAQGHFTWELYCRQLTRLAKVHGFWRYSQSAQAKMRMAQCWHQLYHLYIKPRSAAVS